MKNTPIINKFPRLSLNQGLYNILSEILENCHRTQNGMNWGKGILAAFKSEKSMINKLENNSKR